MPNKFVREPFCASKNFWNRKIWRIREGGVLRFSVKNLLPHNTDKLRRKPFCNSEIFWYRKNLWIWGKWAPITIFRRSFVSQYQKNSWGAPLCFRKVLVRGKGRDGVSRFSVKILSHYFKKIRVGTPMCFRKFLVSKKIKDKRRGGGYHDFLSNFISQGRKKSWGTPP